MVTAPQEIIDARNRLMANGFKIRRITTELGQSPSIVYEDWLASLVDQYGVKAVQEELSRFIIPMLRRCLTAYQDEGIKKYINDTIELYKDPRWKGTIQIGPLQLTEPTSTSSKEGKIHDICGLDLTNKVVEE